MSATVAISRLNHPPICAPVLPPKKRTMLKSEKSGRRSSPPPPSRSQATCWREDSPKGTAVSNANAWFLPV